MTEIARFPFLPYDEAETAAAFLGLCLLFAGWIPGFLYLAMRHFAPRACWTAIALSCGILLLSCAVFLVHDAKEGEILSETVSSGTADVRIDMNAQYYKPDGSRAYPYYTLTLDIGGQVCRQRYPASRKNHSTSATGKVMRLNPDEKYTAVLTSSHYGPGPGNDVSHYTEWQGEMSFPLQFSADALRDGWQTNVQFAAGEDSVCEVEITIRPYLNFWAVVFYGFTLFKPAHAV